MPMSVPFVREIAFEYGAVDQVTPLIRRVIARNPSPFTFKGTGTYIVGLGQVAIIDPGPLDDAHVEAVLKAVEADEVTHILITHTHRDHSPAAAPVKEATGAPTYGFGPHGGNRNAPKVEEGGDYDFKPDVKMTDGDVVTGPGWTIEAVHTPGHTSNHLCFALREENTLFSGDHVMGWSTSVISPPDGNMRHYLASLAKVRDRAESVYWPTHGPAIRNPKAFVQSFLDHRAHRERQIVECIRDGRGTVPEMVEVIYVNTDPRLLKAAGRSVLSHLIQLCEEGRAVSDGPPGLEARFRLP